MLKYLVLLCLLILHVEISSCIQCHQCTTLVSDSCLDYYNDDNVDDCGDKDTHCVKYKTTVLLRDSGYINGEPRRSVVVTRSCERAGGKSDGCSVTTNNGGAVIKCLCSSEGCNNSHVKTFSAFLLFFSLLVNFYNIV